MTTHKNGRNAERINSNTVYELNDEVSRCHITKGVHFHRVFKNISSAEGTIIAIIIEAT
jgi:hypothetical protein